MKRSGSCSCIRVVAVGLLAGLMTAAGPAVGSAAASYPAACSLMGEHDIAKVFELQEAFVEDIVARAPGNPGGVVQIHCRGVAWKGRKPKSTTRQRRALLAGTLAQLRVETWIPDPGPYESTWLANMPGQVEALKERAEAQFLDGPRGGSTFGLPHFAADGAIGYELDTAKTTKLRALWWKATTGEIVAFTIEEARGRSAVFSLMALAARIVPAVRS
jgi:hypothetical protein